MRNLRLNVTGLSGHRPRGPGLFCGAAAAALLAAAPALAGTADDTDAAAPITTA